MNVFSYIIGGILVSASLIAGLLLIFFPPKFLNALYGMSTKSTRKSKKAWDLGHKVCAITLLVYAFFSILAYVLMLILARDFFDNYAFLRIIFGLMYALVGVLIAWATVELELARLGKRTKKEKPLKAKVPAEKATEIPAEVSAETPVEIPAEPVVISAEPVVISAEPVVASAEPVVTPAEPTITPAEPVVAPAEPVVTSAEPVVTPTETSTEVQTETPAETPTESDDGDKA